MAIVWTNSMSTGVTEVDAQHKELLDVLNSLGEAMKAGKGKTEIESILIFAGQYAQKHFACEERYFDQYACPAKSQNEEAHKQFVERFTTFMAEFREQGESFALIMRIYNELSTWLVQHILGVDTKLRPYAKRPQE
jgi:hemerythrin